MPPSPNLPTFASALAYPVTVWLEATAQFTEGRGTSLPFSLVGAPHLDGAALMQRLNAFAIAHRGVGYAEPHVKAHGEIRDETRGEIHGETCDDRPMPRWRSAPFVPTWWKFNSSDCGGVQLVRPCRSELFGHSVELLAALRDASTTRSISWDGSWFGTPGPRLIDEYAGTPRLRVALDSGASSERIREIFSSETRDFEKERKPFLLY